MTKKSKRIESQQCEKEEAIKSPPSFKDMNEYCKKKKENGEEVKLEFSAYPDEYPYNINKKIMPSCKDCIHHAAEHADHYCMRPVHNPVMGTPRRLSIPCLEERWGRSEYPWLKGCGLEGLFFEKKENVG